MVGIRPNGATLCLLFLNVYDIEHIPTQPSYISRVKTQRELWATKFPSRIPIGKVGQEIDISRHRVL